ncbi:MAG: tetratricopeptide repeat protein [Acidimicrobiaceae bacterium]|nr:tetratricopeptide repeat protein [Acidimicrobiaceae bacterium]MYE08976.1 tetratricopeptide repeat protein [Acidimicrobiaceae bacterium]
MRAGAGLHRRRRAVTIEDLEAGLASVRLAEAPDDWALAAYRLAVAKSEAAARPQDIEQALDLLDKAARILDADRAPVEHSRILTAAANCHRAAGRADRALELFRRAAELSAPRAPAAEHAAALINLGLAHCEAGHPEPAIEALDRAVSLMTDGLETGSETANGGRGSDDEPGRVLGAALINRAQARQSLGRDEDVRAALDDYRSAMAALPASSLQAGMAAHGLGAAVLELCRRGVSGWSADDAFDAFEQSLSVLSHTSFPFHHAVARHSLALAYEMRGEPGDLARALNSAHASLSVFDPRLHAVHWRTAHATLARLEDALGEDDPSAGRLGHVARLLADTTDEEREQLLRDRLLRAASLPATGARADLEALIGSVAALPRNGYRDVLRDMIGVLMELPDQLLETACDVLCRVHREHDSTDALDETLDSVISERLFGPQRVRVRDLLEANGWVRP